MENGRIKTVDVLMTGENKKEVENLVANSNIDDVVSLDVSFTSKMSSCCECGSLIAYLSVTGKLGKHAQQAY